MAAFILDGLLSCRWLATLPAAPAAPTQAEITAGTNLIGTKQTEELIEINGFEKTPETIPLPGYAGRDVGALAGQVSYAQSSLAWREDLTSTTIKTLMGTDGTPGFLFFGRKGQGVGKPSLIFPVEIASTNERQARNAAAAFETFFSIQAPYKGSQAA